ncbi:unnamed protein product [Polarella glacialis]|uniref:Uncharacterized protein n=1 Tax=Polarella glacialis TaxID=89957 RepID=A0A813KAX0_POLGL|nr:unnamed protein product [Polarella glacialis]CAE8702084.1 unnamed protein product [Polarella glacialis]|mmetsp:Transcript_65796/g.106088  ORF Transcript_65796/g.106088 Transcript_65796/m.106088 type:complete len:158 (+) Transcript_65796:162-635(+)
MMLALIALSFSGMVLGALGVGQCITGQTGGVMGVQALTAGSGCYAITVKGTRYFGEAYTMENCWAIPHEKESGLICCDTDECNAPKASTIERFEIRNPVLGRMWISGYGSVAMVTISFFLLLIGSVLVVKRSVANRSSDHSELTEQSLVEEAPEVSE